MKMEMSFFTVGTPLGIIRLLFWALTSVIIEQASAAGCATLLFESTSSPSASVNRSDEDSKCGNRKMGKNGSIRA